MIAFDAAMLALAASALLPSVRGGRWVTALAPWAAVAAGWLAASLPGSWQSAAVLAPLLLAALTLRRAAAPALLLMLPDYAQLGDALLASILWLGGSLLLATLFERLDRARWPAPLEGAPLRLLCCGGFALVLQPLSLL